MCSQINDYDGTGAAVNFERVSSFIQGYGVIPLLIVYTIYK